jgi:GNAT superfamily N-acetyltransferase
MSAKPPIESLGENDVSQALRLSTAAGWNQIEGDWVRLIRLWPDSCFAMRDADRLIGTGTLAHYGTLGWIGMILVDEPERGRGLGSAMMGHLLRHADARPLTSVGLDATELGRPIYQKLGFEDQREIVRWAGPAHAARASTRSATPNDRPAIARLDRAAAGVDRSPLLRTISAEAGAQMRVVERRGEIVAFGLSRRGRTAAHIGPVIALSVEDAEAIVADLRCDAAESRAAQVFIDVPAESELSTRLPRAGFAVQRRLMRMMRPASGVLSDPRNYAGAGFELG